VRGLSRAIEASGTRSAKSSGYLLLFVEINILATGRLLLLLLLISIASGAETCIT
jgi:hypothetical protein